MSLCTYKAMSCHIFDVYGISQRKTIRTLSLSLFETKVAANLLNAKMTKLCKVISLIDVFFVGHLFLLMMKLSQRLVIHSK